MRRLTLISSLLVLCCACSRVAPENVSLSFGSGAVRMALCMDRSAGVNSDALLDESLVKIYNGDFSGMIRRYAYKDLPSEIILASGSYRMDIEAGEMVKPQPDSASWNLKSYKGSQNFTIEAGTTQTISITAGIYNVVSIVNFDPSIDEFLQEGYTFSIGPDLNRASQYITYTGAESGREAYFITTDAQSDLYWYFSGTVKSSGNAVTKGGVIEGASRGKSYTLTPKYINRDGYLSFALSVNYDVEEVDDMIVFEPVSTGLKASKQSEIWAGHATIHADVDEVEFQDPEKIKFSYSSNGTDWTTIDSSRDAQGEYSGIMKGLKGNTTYSYKLVIDGQVIGDAFTLTTDKATQLPNYTFETTSNAESSKYTSFYDPSSSEKELQTKFWDSGSSGSTTAGASYAICYSDSDVPSGIGSTKSARLQSLNAVIKFAAGNLFVGEFAGLVGTSGGMVNFGRPWNGARPTAVRFWYKYLGGKVDKGCSYITTSEYDLFCIKVACGTWSHTKYGGSASCPVQVNTTKESTFWDYPKLPETIAYCVFEERGNGSLGAWKQVTIPLTYYTETEYPTVFVVSAAASKYGDYFAGSYSSKLYLDNFELVYE